MKVVLLLLVVLSAGSSGLHPLSVPPEGLPAVVQIPDGIRNPLPSGQKRSLLQRQRLIPSQGKEVVPAAAMHVFDLVEQGLASGTVANFSDQLASSVSMQLRGSEGGYHSATQAYYILTSFLNMRKPVSVVLSTYGATDGIPYATGAATFAVKGMREDLQVYVALHASGDRWVITHLNMY